MSLRRTVSPNVFIFSSSVQSPSYGESGTSQIYLSLSFRNTSRTVAESPVISAESDASVGVLKELNCDWPKELMEICLLLTHQYSHLYCGILTRIRDSGNQHTIA